jgi:hypothetical protein
MMILAGALAFIAGLIIGATTAKMARKEAHTDLPMRQHQAAMRALARTATPRR